MSTLNVAIVVFGALTALFMLGGGVGKVTGQPAMRESAQHFEIQWERYRFLGVVEIAAAVGVVAGLWLNGLGLAAGVGVTALWSAPCCTTSASATRRSGRFRRWWHSRRRRRTSPSRQRRSGADAPCRNSCYINSLKAVR